PRPRAPRLVDLAPSPAAPADSASRTTITPLDTPVHNMRSSVHDHLGAQWTHPNAMTGRNDRVELLQGTLDLIVLQALATMGAQHAYGLTARLEQVAEHPFSLNQGTLYPALV